MSVADHFDHIPDAGFIRSYDAHMARRQFQVSMILIIVLALAAFALGLLVRFDGSGSSTMPASPANAKDVHFAVSMPKAHI